MPSTNPDEVTDLAGVRLIPVNSLQPMIKQVSVKLGGALKTGYMLSQEYFPFNVLLNVAVNC
jgi:hypothetical protein